MSTFSPPDPCPPAARAALEALFMPKNGAPKESAASRPEAPPAQRGRLIVNKRDDVRDVARTSKTDRLLLNLLVAEGRLDVTRAATRLREAGMELPRTQEASLALLEHNDESLVRDAIAILTQLLRDKPVDRRTLLESRLRRLAEYAEDAATREAAETLRKSLPLLLTARTR